MFNKVPARLRPTSGVLKPLHLDATPRNSSPCRRNENGGNKNNKNKYKYNNKNNKAKKLKNKPPYEPKHGDNSYTRDTTSILDRHDADRARTDRDYVVDTGGKKVVSPSLTKVSYFPERAIVPLANRPLEPAGYEDPEKYIEQV